MNLKKKFDINNKYLKTKIEELSSITRRNNVIEYRNLNNKNKKDPIK